MDCSARLLVPAAGLFVIASLSGLSW